MFFVEKLVFLRALKADFSSSLGIGKKKNWILCLI